MDYPTKAPPQFKPAGKVEREKQTLAAWVVDLCYCKECRDGFVSKETNGYSTLYACPLCDRSKRDLYPYQAIPSAKKWMGSFTRYTEVEMGDRRRNRQEVVDGLRKGAGRIPNVDTREEGVWP